MTATNHALTGAAIALLVKQPVLALPLAFLSHYVLDAVPHFGIPGSIAERNQSVLGRVVVGTDIVLFLTLMIALPLTAHPVINPLLLLLCMFAAYSPDAVYLVRFAKELQTGTYIVGGPLSRFHRRIQWAERPWGIGVEVVYLTVVSLLVMNRILV